MRMRFSSLNESECLGFRIKRQWSPPPQNFSLPPSIALTVDFCFLGKISAHFYVDGWGFQLFVIQRFPPTSLAHGRVPLFSFYTMITVICKQCLRDTRNESCDLHAWKLFHTKSGCFPLLSSVMRTCWSWQIASLILLNIWYIQGYLWVFGTQMLGIVDWLGSSLNWELLIIDLS